jgi:hypothetical protein
MVVNTLVMGGFDEGWHVLGRGEKWPYENSQQNEDQMERNKKSYASPGSKIRAD